MNEQQVFTSLINALNAPQETAMTTSLIQSVRRESPVTYNRAVAQVNAQRKQRGQQPLRWEPVNVGQAASAPAVSQTVQQTVNTAQQQSEEMAADDEMDSLDDDEMESLDEASGDPDPDYSQFDQSVAADVTDTEDFSEDDDSMEDDDEVPADEPVDEDFEDDESVLESLEQGTGEHQHVEGFESRDLEPLPTIENLSFKHSLALNIYLNSEEGEVYSGPDGKFYTTKQPLRRGKGLDSDATGAVRASLENFIEGVKAEGEGIRFAVAVPDTVVATYISSLNSDMEARLSQTFDPEANAYIDVTSVTENSENPWGGNNAVIAHREIALRFSIPAIVSAARKRKDEVKMLASNLKIVNNLVRTLRESTNLENVQVNIFIEDAIVSDMMGIFQALMSEGNMPTFDRGYARFTVQTEDSMGGEVEG